MGAKHPKSLVVQITADASFQFVRDWKRNFKWPFTERVELLIYNGTLVWSSVN